jgi:hypothetical protein
LGRLAAPAVALKIYAASSDSSVWNGDGSNQNRRFSDFQLIGGTYLNLGNKAERTCEQLVPLPVSWVPRQNAPTAMSWRLLAVAGAPTDPAPVLASAGIDRHAGGFALEMDWAALDNGTIRTDDPRDRIQYVIEHGAAAAGTVSFRLVNGPSAFDLPKVLWFNEAGFKTWSITARKGSPAERSVSLNEVRQGGLGFGKGDLNVVTVIGNLGGLECLEGGDRVNLYWNAG